MFSKLDVEFVAGLLVSLYFLNPDGNKDVREGLLCDDYRTVFVFDAGSFFSTHSLMIA